MTSWPRSANSRCATDDSAGFKGKDRSGIMLGQRLTSAAVLVAVLLSILWLDHQHPLWGVTGLWLLVPLGLLVVGTCLDIVRLLAAAGHPSDPIGATLAALAVPLTAYVPSLWPLLGTPYPADCPLQHSGWIVVGLAMAMLAIFLRQMATYDPQCRGVALRRLLGSVFVAGYVGLPFAVMFAIRSMGPPGWGLSALITMVVVTKVADAGAYFAGKLAGRHKLVPRLSPGKTWEGAVGGIVAAVAASYGCFLWLFPALDEAAPPAPWWAPLLLGVVGMLAGLVGDLVESLVKRETGAKDSGQTLPGLGGVWDVTDSPLLVAAPAWVIYAALV